MRCASAGAERRGGVLCADPAYVVIPQAKKKRKKKESRDVKKKREKRLLLDSRFCTNHLRSSFALIACANHLQ